MSEGKGAAAGAADFKGWYVVVWLTPGGLEWPRRCACCLRRPETSQTIEEGSKLIGHYPICRVCRRHAKADDVAMGVSITIAALVVVGGWIALGLSVMYRVGIQLVLMLLAFALITGATYCLMGLFFRNKGVRCPDEGWPVETYRPAGFGSVLGDDAERTDEKNLREWCSRAAGELGSGAYALQLLNYDYAREFIRTNGGDPSRMHTIHEAF